MGFEAPKKRPVIRYFDPHGDLEKNQSTGVLLLDVPQRPEFFRKSSTYCAGVQQVEVDIGQDIGMPS